MALTKEEAFVTKPNASFDMPLTQELKQLIKKYKKATFRALKGQKNIRFFMSVSKMNHSGHCKIQELMDKYIRLGPGHLIHGEQEIFYELSAECIQAYTKHFQLHKYVFVLDVNKQKMYGWKQNVFLTKCDITKEVEDKLQSTLGKSFNLSIENGVMLISGKVKNNKSRLKFQLFKQIQKFLSIIRCPLLYEHCAKFEYEQISFTYSDFKCVACSRMGLAYVCDYGPSIKNLLTCTECARSKCAIRVPSHHNPKHLIICFWIDKKRTAIIKFMNEKLKNMIGAEIECINFSFEENDIVSPLYLSACNFDSLFVCLAPHLCKWDIENVWHDTPIVCAQSSEGSQKLSGEGLQELKCCLKMTESDMLDFEYEHDKLCWLKRVRPVYFDKTKNGKYASSIFDKLLNACAEYETNNKNCTQWRNQTIITSKDILQNKDDSKNNVDDRSQLYSCNEKRNEVQFHSFWSSVEDTKQIGCVQIKSIPHSDIGEARNVSLLTNSLSPTAHLWLSIYLALPLTDTLELDISKDKMKRLSNFCFPAQGITDQRTMIECYEIVKMFGGNMTFYYQSALDSMWLPGDYVLDDKLHMNMHAVFVVKPPNSTYDYKGTVSIQVSIAKTCGNVHVPAMFIIFKNLLPNVEQLTDNHLNMNSYAHVICSFPVQTALKMSPKRVRSNKAYFEMLKSLKEDIKRKPTKKDLEKEYKNLQKVLSQKTCQSIEMYQCHSKQTNLDMIYCDCDKKHKINREFVHNEFDVGCAVNSTKTDFWMKVDNAFYCRYCVLHCDIV